MLFCCFSMIDWVDLSLTYLTRPNFDILSLVSLGECAYYDADTLVILGPNSAEETSFLVVDRWGFEQSQIIPSDVQRDLMVLAIDHRLRWTQTWGFYIRFYATINSSTEMYCFDGSMIGCAHCWLSARDELRDVKTETDRDCGKWRVTDHVSPFDMLPATNC